MIPFTSAPRTYVSRSRNKENAQSSSIVSSDLSKSSGPTRRRPRTSLNFRQITRSIPRSTHAFSRPPSPTILSRSLHENPHVLVPHSKMKKMSMRSRRSWTIRRCEGNDGTWCIGWDIPHPTTNGLTQTTSMHPRFSNHTSIRSTQLRNALLMVPRNVLLHVLLCRTVTPQSQNLRREGCKATCPAHLAQP